MEKNLAVVLGGGGSTGNAWEVGILAGLAEAGLDLGRLADTVLGTSAGATAAAHLRSDVPPADQLAAVLAEQAPGMPAGRGPGAPDPARMDAHFARLRQIGTEATSAQEMRRALGHLALELDDALAAGAARRHALVASRLPDLNWPARHMAVVAVDASTGDVALIDSTWGVPLADAVTASTAMPGSSATQEIDGRRFVDGGVRSTENADLALGHAHVVVVSPLCGPDLRPRPAQPGQFEGLRREDAWGTTLASQVELLRAHGADVAVLTPDDASRAAMGDSLMDLAARVPSARAGHAQGLRERARIPFGQ